MSPDDARSARVWHEIGDRTSDPAVAAERFAVVGSVLGAALAAADVDLRVARGDLPAAVGSALESLRARRRTRWSRRVRVQVAELGHGVDDPSPDPQVRRGRADVRRVAGYAHVTLVGVDGALVGAVHDGLVTAALTPAQVLATGSRLGVEPREIVSPPTGLAALLSMRPHGPERR